MSLQGYGTRLGANLLTHGHLRAGLRYLIKPVNYWRTAEFAAVCREAHFHRADRILDIGSPKLLALYLADRVGAEVHATDIEPCAFETLALARNLRGISPSRLALEVEDGRRLSFAEASFDKVYSVSVLEHIPDQGDTLCIEEIHRVLKPGGRCVLTVPFAPISREEFRQGDFYWSHASKQNGDGFFYQRRYSEADLHHRLIRPSQLRLRTLSYIGEKVPMGDGRELHDFLPDISGPIQPLLSRLLHTAPAPSWRELKSPLCAVVSLEKRE